jgi:uncharacterized protein with von Willebrand factor type A (vWA) domain
MSRDDQPGGRPGRGHDCGVLAPPPAPFSGSPTPDLAELAATLGAALRQRGIAAGPGRCERFAAAVGLVRPSTAEALYQCALATLTSGPDEAATLRQVLASLPSPLAGHGPWPGGRPPDAAGDPAGTDGWPGPGDDRAPEPRAATDTSGPERGSSAGPDSGRASRDPARQRGYLASVSERLAGTDFAELTAAELAGLAAIMRQIRVAVPARRSRRYRRRPGGPSTDLRATLRQARRTGGDPFRLVGRRPASKPRKLVVLCDISGSMEPYARALIQLMYCAAGAATAEVFTFATRLTRLTPVLSRSMPDAALRRAGEAAPDWHGGTRIGACLREFNDAYGRRGLARGAVILIISDGWDTGPAAELGRQMARLSLVAHRIVWVNPRAKSAVYRPLAAGMAAAWRHCDAVVSGHSLAALGQLTAALADPSRRRGAVRPGDTLGVR